MKPVTKKDIIQSCAFIIVLSISIIAVAKYLGDSKMEEFKKNGNLAQSTILNKHIKYSKTSSSSNKEYFLNVNFFVDDSINGKFLTSTDLKVYIEDFESVKVGDDIPIIYLINSPNTIELESTVLD